MYVETARRRWKRRLEKQYWSPVSREQVEGSSEMDKILSVEEGQIKLSILWNCTCSHSHNIIHLYSKCTVCTNIIYHITKSLFLS